MIMAQNAYEKIVRAMTDKGVPHYAFELLSELRSNEVNNSIAVDIAQDAVCKLTKDYRKALDEITESHSGDETIEHEGEICVVVSCGCEFCEQWRRLYQE